jgi:transposase-like protein
MLNPIEFKTILDVVQRFPTERSCQEYLASRRWSDGVMICPHEGCGHDKAYVYKDGIRYKCKKCRLVYTAKTGTFMEASKLPTIKWFLALYLVLHKKGISSVQLAKDIGVQQRTAWFVLHRIRFALGNEPEQQLSGTIQLDETFVGGKNKNRHHDKKVKGGQGRSFKDKTPVMGMLQQEISKIVPRPNKIESHKIVKEKIIISNAKLICKVIPDTKTESLQPIIRKFVEPGSIVVSDEWFAYRGLGNVYDHQIVDHQRKQYVNDLGFTSNAMESSWTQFKLTINGTYVRPTRKHLDKYKSEFVFRYNNRHLGVQGQIDCVIANMECRLKYKDLVA